MLHPLRVCRRWCYMSTYEELQLIVSVAVLIVAILNYTTYRTCHWQLLSDAEQ